MDSQQFEYWHPQREPYQQPQATYYEYTTPDLASIPSLSASPTSTATFDAAGTPTPAPQPQPMQHQHQQQQQQQQHQSQQSSLYNHHQNQPASSYHHNSSFAYTLPVAPNDFGSVDAAVAATALPSPPYVCSPQQSNADLGGPYGIPSSSETYPPLQIVNEQVGGFQQHQGGRAPPIRSASNGSTWSVGSASGAVQAERTHVTSGRRRAQNRAAQRAFRERKEKHAKDLEAKLAVLSDRYGRLEASHKELGEAYEKLRRTLELLMEPAPQDDEEAEDDADGEFIVDESLEGVVGEAEALLARGSLSRRRDLSERETLRKLMEILHAPRVGGVAGEEEATAASRGRRVKCEG